MWIQEFLKIMTKREN